MGRRGLRRTLYFGDKPAVEALKDAWRRWQKGKPMEKSWLIQRLEKPHEFMLGRSGFKDNPFSFGGGYKNGGLSDDAMNLLRECFAFDYMGAAEYEFGDVPKALNAIAQLADKKKLVAASFAIALKDVADTSYSRFRKKGDIKPTPPEGVATIYILCREGDEEEIEGRIRGWAGESYERDIRDTTHLARVLRPPVPDEFPMRVAGWLELNNPFMFFTDDEMWGKTCNLFAVARPTLAS